MDFFCGSGTTLIASQELGRTWIGIDQSEKAIEVTKKKINAIPNSLFSSVNYDYLYEKNIEEYTPTPSLASALNIARVGN